MNQSDQTRRSDEQLKAVAERYLSDTSLDRWRSLPRRRLLVAGTFVAIAGLVWVTWIEASFLWWAVFAGLALAGYLALRRIVRGMADLPDRVIDERMAQVRNQTYRVAYLTLVSLTSLALLVVWIAADAARFDFQLAAPNLHAMFWGFLFLAAVLPSALLAWTESEL